MSCLHLTICQLGSFTCKWSILPGSTRMQDNARKVSWAPLILITLALRVSSEASACSLQAKQQNCQSSYWRSAKQTRDMAGPQDSGCQQEVSGANHTSCAEVPFFSSDHRPDGARLLFPAEQWTLHWSICSSLPHRALSSKVQAAIGLASAPSCRHGEDGCKGEVHTSILPIALTHGTSSISISAVSATIPISAIVCSLSEMYFAILTLGEAARSCK